MNDYASNREGFVLPAVLFTIAILGLIAVAALTTANDEHRSSRAMRESGAALYAAEAGANLILGTVVAPPKTVLDTLAVWMAYGGSVDLGWSTLPGGASYHGMFHRYDTGGQKSFFLTVTGRGAGPWGGEQVISYALAPNGEFGIPMTAAVVGGGSLANVRLDSAGLLGVSLSGLDTIPAQLGAACYPLDDRAGITWRDTDPSIVRLENGAVVTGSPPPIQMDPTITPTSPFEWGDFNYDSLVAWATLTLAGGADPPFVKPDVTGSTCNLLWTNWGDPIDNTSPCFDYFPIIHVAGDIRIRGNVGPGNGIGQGILLVDGIVRIEDNFEFHGMIIAKGEIRLEDDVKIFGGLIAGERLRVEDNSTVRRSTCAMNRAFSRLAGKAGLLAPIGSRAWMASVR